jgi:hypothetical protein
MSKNQSRNKRNKELKEQYLDGENFSESLRVDKNGLKIGDLDIKALDEQAAEFLQELEEDKEEEAKKAEKEFDEVIETRRELLELFEEDNLEMEVLYKRKLLKLHLHPVDGSANLKALDLNIHAELSDLEKSVLDPEKQEDLSPSEKKLQEKTMKKLEKDMSKNLLEYTYQILSQFVFFPDMEDMPVEERQAFWKKLPFDLKMFISVEAMKRLGLEPAADIKLFQASTTP